ncbi:MAG: hypothetical protein K0S76_543 [Herbinix sp.]|jgi:DNA repair exonuclease SbcCD nuclease subunit|nr:hypothetical protein [Herbinix sp.]
MKFIHIADVHLGAVPDSNMPWGADREREIWEGFQKIIDVCNMEKADLLLIAGDLFHKQPLIKELKEVNYYFGKLKTAQVVLMAGNHDHISTRSNYRGFEWDQRVHMFMSDTLDTIDFPEINTGVSGFSYYTRDITEPLYDAIKPDKNGKIHILLAHGGDDKDIPINKNRLLDAGYDYIGLGHIHKPEMISNIMAYSGSLEPLDRNETGERGYILGEITSKGEKHTKISFKPSSRREYKRIILPVTQTTTNGALMDQAKEAIQENGNHHIYTFTIQGVRDEAIQFDREAIRAIGNVLEVIDQSVPDYDFDTLFRENADNIIGLFIQKILENTEQDEIAKKALYYGMEALLGAKEE